MSEASRQLSFGWYGIPRTVCAVVAAAILSERGDWVLAAIAVVAAICSLLARRMLMQAFEGELDEGIIANQQLRLLIVTVAKLGIPMLLLAGVLSVTGWWRG